MAFVMAFTMMPTMAFGADTTLTVIAPKEATVKFYKQESNYVVSEKTGEATATEDVENGTITYTIPSGTGYQYRASMDGKVTEAGYLSAGNPVTVAFLEDREATTIQSDLAYDDNSILLNIDDTKDTNELAMQVGQTFKVRAFRGSWEIVDSTTGNKMIEPDMHFEVLSGADVVSIEKTNASEKGEGYCAGNSNGNWLNVSALKEGTAVVAVWYDAINITGSKVGTFFGASDPARYGVFVVNVGQDVSANWKVLSSDGDWDSEFDTVYYVGENGLFNLEASDIENLTVQNIYGKTAGEIKSVAKENGKFSVPVTSGANLLTATTAKGTDYMVVRAKEISYTITNNTTGEAKTNAAPAISTGDNVTIALDGLNAPVPKMAGIYNPGYMGTAKLLYNLNDDLTLMSTGTQYDFVSNPKGNSITFDAWVPGINQLEGYISLTSMGDDFGNHRNITDLGRTANMNAAEKMGQFGILPNISFEVANTGATPSYEDVTKLSAVSLFGGPSAYMNCFNFKKAQSEAMTWTKANSAMATYGITVKATATSYMNDLKFKYWYEGEEATTVELTSGIATTIENPNFDNTKILNMEIIVAPKDPDLGSPKVLSYVVYPGGDNGSTSLSYVHPIISAISFTDGNGVACTLLDDMGYTRTDYDLAIRRAKKLNLDMTMLTKVKNEEYMTADQSDKVELILKKDGAQVGQTIVADPGSSYPTQKCTYDNLELGDADTLVIKVTSYVNGTSREYTFNLIRSDVITVRASLSDRGNVILADKEISVADLNYDGKFTVDEVFVAMHDDSYPGGASAGYSSYESQWGLSIGKLWGDESGAYGFWTNNVSGMSLDDEVQDGDYFVGAIYFDQTTWSDRFGYFNAHQYDAIKGVAKTILLCSDYWGTVSAEEGAKIEVYDQEMKNVDESLYTVNDKGEGSYQLSINAEGTFTVIAKQEDKSIIPAIAKIKVTACTHEKTNEAKVDLVPAKIGKDGSYTIVTCCTVCGDEIERDEITIPAVKSATLSTTKYTYTGKAKTPVVTVKDAMGNRLVKNVDYTLTYASGRKLVGKYTVKINFKGDYAGSKTLSFTIVPKTPTIKSLTVGTKSLKVKTYTKPSAKGGNYYQIAYKLKGSSKWVYTTTNTSYKTIKKLKSGKVYSVKIRAFRKVGTTKYYGGWSKIKVSKKIK